MLRESQHFEVIFEFPALIKISLFFEYRLHFEEAESLIFYAFIL